MLTWFAGLPVVEKVGWLVLILVLLGFVFAVFFFGLRKVMEWQKNLEAKDGGKVARQTLIGAAILVTIIIILIILWKVPEWQVAYLENNIEPKDLFDKENEARRTVAQIIGGFALLIGIYLTWRRIAATERNLEIAQDGQITERFTRAIEQLGNEKLEVRMGGIYALERIARDSEKDHWPIMEVLTAYVRENAPWPPQKTKSPPDTQRSPSEAAPGGNPPDQIAIPAGGVTDGPPPEKETKPKPRADIQAILTVLGRRERTYEKRRDQSLDLGETDLRGAYLREAHLEGANLIEARLEGAGLQRAHLEGAFLGGARLEGAGLQGAHLEGAKLQEADFRKAKNLTKDQVIRAHCWPLAFFDAGLLKELGLPPDHNERLQRKDLSGYNLEGIDLRGAFLVDFNLKQANLEGADLSGAKGLSQEQIDAAYCDDETELPPGLQPSGKKKPRP